MHWRILTVAAVLALPAAADELLYLLAAQTYGSNSQTSPEPTDAPLAPALGLGKRQVPASVCGYVDGLASEKTRRHRSCQQLIL